VRMFREQTGKTSIVENNMRTNYLGSYLVAFVTADSSGARHGRWIAAHPGPSGIAGMSKGLDGRSFSVIATSSSNRRIITLKAQMCVVTDWRQVIRPPPHDSVNTAL
jgi:hypothetical protein